MQCHLYMGVPESFLYQSTRYTLSPALCVAAPEVMSHGRSACSQSEVSIALHQSQLTWPPSTVDTVTAGLSGARLLVPGPR